LPAAPRWCTATIWRLGAADAHSAHFVISHHIESQSPDNSTSWQVIFLNLTMHCRDH
jgi:hypothetical protein